MKVKKSTENMSFTPSDPTKITKMGNIIDIVVSKKVNHNPVCRKVSKDMYCITSTGEVKEYQHTQNRGQCSDSLRRTFRHIRELVNTNVNDCKSVRWVTLTYRENMTDTTRLYTDFKNFWKRFLYYCDAEGWTRPEYITVIEPQGRGAWHIHGVFIWNEAAPFIENSILAELWRYGFVSIKEPKYTDNLGAYFSAYLTDMANEDIEKLPSQLRYEALSTACTITGSADLVEKTDEDGRAKKIIKYARLALYPPGTNIYRCSRGIKRPEISQTTYSNALQCVKCSCQTFQQSYVIQNSEGEVVNRILKASYNTKRKSEDQNA